MTNQIDLKALPGTGITPDQNPDKGPKCYYTRGHSAEFLRTGRTFISHHPNLNTAASYLNHASVFVHSEEDVLFIKLLELNARAAQLGLQDALHNELSLVLSLADSLYRNREFTRIVSPI